MLTKPFLEPTKQVLSTTNYPSASKLLLGLSQSPENMFKLSFWFNIIKHSSSSSFWWTWVKKKKIQSHLSFRFNIFTWPIITLNFYLNKHSATICCVFCQLSLKKMFLNYLFEKHKDKERKWTCAKGKTQEPGNPSRSLIWVAGNQLPKPPLPPPPLGSALVGNWSETLAVTYRTCIAADLATRLNVLPTTKFFT